MLQVALFLTNFFCLLIIDSNITHFVGLYFFFHCLSLLFFLLAFLFKGKHTVIGNFQFSHLILFLLLFNCLTFNVQILLFIFLYIYFGSQFVEFFHFKSISFFYFFLCFFDISLISFLFPFEVFNSIFNCLFLRTGCFFAFAQTLMIRDTLILLARASADQRMLLFVFIKCARYSGALRRISLAQRRYFVLLILIYFL